MKRYPFISICCFIIFNFIFSYHTNASIFVPSTGKYIWQAVERVVIAHENNDQTMILSPLYQGEKTDFAWVVPTPNKLQINTVNYELFSNLDEIASNDFSIYHNIIGDDTNIEDLEISPDDLYTVNTFKFAEASDMLDWLNSKGYDLPENSSYLVENYIYKDWYFNIIEIDSENLLEDMGFLPPLSISFTTENLIYPIKLKSLRLLWQNLVSSKSDEDIKEVESELERGQTDFSSSSSHSMDSLPESTKIDMYILSENRKTHADFETTFGSWLKKDQINSLSKNSDSKNWYSCQNSKLFFTKLNSTIKYTNYTNDLVFKDALDNTELLKTKTESGSSNAYIWFYIIACLIFLILLFISPIGLSFILGLYLIKPNQAGFKKVIGLFIQVISVLFLIGLMFFSYLLVWGDYLKKLGWDRVRFSLDSNNYQFNESNIKYLIISVLISQIVFLVWMIAIWSTQNKKKLKLISHDGKTTKEMDCHDEIGKHIFEKSMNSKNPEDPEFEVELEKKSNLSKDQKSDAEELPSFEDTRPKSKIVKPKTKKIKVDKG
ncbi:DUF2330 domain-containing protein [Patescibacteria group bacterium]